MPVVNVTPENLLKEGLLAEAMHGLTAQVRGDPADPARRVFLFQLLSLMGQWERAENQLIVSGELDSINALMVSAYAFALRGEREREVVMAGRGKPTVVGEPSSWQAMLLQSLQWLQQGNREEALPLREQAFDLAETVRGRIDGVQFDWIADADARFGPCLEIILKTGYAWVPFSRLREIAFDAPTDLRDRVWTPVRITWSNGGEAIGFVPTRYPGSDRAADSDLVLARRTEWTNLGGDCFVGSGQRMLVTDIGEYPLLDIRTLAFEPA